MAAASAGPPQKRRVVRQHTTPKDNFQTVLTLETPRLLLRQFRPTDIDPYAAMCADPDVMRYMGERGVLNRDDAWRQLAMLAGHWQLRGFGMWAVEERASGNFIGRVGLHFPDGWPDKEIGWALTRASWGKGFAFEAASAALAYAFGPLQWSRIISLIAPDNGRSIRLAERLGEQFEKEVEVRGHRVALYSLGRDAWRAA